MRYITEYQKRRYVKRGIRRELYEAFIEWCGERSINLCLEKALSILRGNITVNAGGNTPPSATSRATAKSKERKHVIVFNLEWARQKGIDTEEYMARKEREGYLCNEAGRKIYCIWREDIEQLVADLNDAGAKMGGLDKVLTGEKLETAKVAVEAGLLWFSSKEQRWQAPL
jgi:hypothetical protein